MDTANLKRDVRRAARGDEDSAAVLFDEYHPRLYRYALAKLKDHSDAEDVASETFARVLRDLDRFRWKGAGFEAWIFRIAANLIVDRFRSGARERPDDDVTAQLEPLATESAEDVAMRAATGRDLGTLLDTLPEDQREVLILRFAAGLDTAAAGRAMGRRANAVRQLQFRALQNVRSKLQVETAP